MLKYEHATNRISASRLSAIADVLSVPISFFFDDLPADDKLDSVEQRESRERMERPEMVELVRLYYAITDNKMRQSFLDMVKAIAADSATRRGSRSVR